MKKISQFLVFTALLVFTAFVGCKKDESEEMIDILTSKTWRFGLKDLNTSTNPPGNNVLFAVTECEQDDTFTFRADGKMLRAYGAKKCDGNTAANKTVDYIFNKETKELTIDGVKYAVVEENKTQFKYYRVVPNATGSNNTIYLLH